MAALLDATDSQVAALAGLVEALEVAEATLSSMHAARDGLLAIAHRLAMDLARQGDHPDKGDHAIRSVAAEIAAAQRVSDRTVQRRMGAAAALVEDFPEVWQAQGAGRISAGHARVIVEAGAHLTDPADRAAYAVAVLEVAVRESPNRVRPVARRIAERFQERTLTDRHRDARTRRRVWAVDGEDGMAGLHLHGPAVLVHGMFDRITQMAHTLRDANRRAARDAARSGDTDFIPDDRTVDELRADLLAELVLSGTPHAHDTPDATLGDIRGHVTITVPVTTLMTGDTTTPDPTHATDADADADAGAGAGSDTFDHADNDVDSDTDLDLRGDSGVDGHARAWAQAASPPAELDGAIPIDTDTARWFAGTAPGWDRVMTDPVTGATLTVDRYRPNRHLRRHLRARDQRCRFPGCRITARACDLDHTHAAATGGPTTDTNLATLCRRHHTLKHHTPWHVQHLPNGSLEWTSPTGHTYIDQPPPQNTITFHPTPTWDTTAWDAAAWTSTDTSTGTDAPF